MDPTANKHSQEWVGLDPAQLRIGMYVALDIAWMAHSFPSGNFKISSLKQIASIQALGLPQVRVRRSTLTDPQGDASVPPPATTQESSQQSLTSRPAALADPERSQRAKLLEMQRHALDVCERRFSDSAKLYRATADRALTQPQSALEPCKKMVQGFVTELLGGPETSIRLLSESAGDKAALHPVNVTVLALLLGQAIGLHANALQDLGVAAFLHDLGKIKLPDRVRHEDAHFSTTETRMYQEHVSLGLQMAKEMQLSRGAVQAIAQHHELADGSGFPHKLKNEAASVSGRILALVNRYDNLCNPARPGVVLTPHEALALIYAQFRMHFDQPVLSAFIRMMGVYPPGSVVQLIDDRYALVVSVNANRPLRPRMIVHDPNVPRREALIVDLEHVAGVNIRRSLKPSHLPAEAFDYLRPHTRINYFFEQNALHGMEPSL